jgi:hypothetical protein
MKALPINVYRDTSGDCTNGGISSRYDQLLLIGEKGFIDIDENNIPENAVKLVVRNFGTKEYKNLEPVRLHDKNKTTYMYGGNIAYTSDSRFPSDYPLKIHDRQETYEEYDALSR